MSGSSPVLLGAAVAIMIAASPSMRDPAHRSGSNVVVCDANTTHGLDVLDAKWSNCTHVVGDLSPPNVHAFGVLNLSSVVSVTGDIKLGMSSFSSIDLSGLVSVGGDVDIFSNDELEAVDLSSLEFVHGDLKVRYNSKLSSLAVSLASLNFVGGDLEVSLTPDLDEIDSNETDAFADSLREAAIALSIDVAASPLADVAVGGARKFGIGDSVV